MLAWLGALFRRKSAISSKGKLHLLSCQIHGSHYYDCLRLVNEGTIHPGERLLLKREPSNEYDQYAIEVLTANGYKLGYVPKNHNRVIAELMDQHCIISAVVDSVKSNEWEPVSITITLDKA